MADSQPERRTVGAISTTALTAGGATTGFVVVKFLVDPSWPPPDAILAIVVGWATPAAHLVGRVLMRRLRRAAGELEPDPSPSPRTSEGEDHV